MAGSSGGGAGSLAKAIESIHPADNRHVVAIFDHDQEGIKTFESLSKNFKTPEGVDYEKKHTNEHAAALTLAVAGENLPTLTAKNLCIEYLFDNDVLQLKSDTGIGLVFKDQELQVAAAGKKLQLTQEQQNLFADVLGDISAYRTISDGKKAFAEEVVPNLDTEKFGRFSVLFGRVISALRIVN